MLDQHFVRSFLQGIILVASILLAFAIDAWWNELEEEEEARALLQAFRIELSENMQRMDEEIAFRQAKRASVERMLLASIGEVTLQDGEMDSLINDITHWGETNFETGALSALVDSGKLAWVDSLELRAALASWPQRVEDYVGIEEQDHRRIETYLFPYLTSRASFPKISNAWRGRPGDTTGTIYVPDNKGLMPDPYPRNHNLLLQESEFISIITMVMWDQSDGLFMAKAWVEQANALDTQIAEFLEN